jgi:TRAP-type mannitol/chloroaromatic compound transport system permease small subunit
MDLIVRTIDALSMWIGRAASLIVIPLVLATCYEVFARYLFGAPTIWAFELGYILMGLHFLLGGAMTLKMQQHVRIDLIYARLSLKRQAVIDLTLYVALVIPALTMTSLQLGDHMMGAYMGGETTGQSAWNPAIWPFRALITFSFIVLTLQVIAESLRALHILLDRPIQKEST